ncbi:hypothetical protein AXF42_Ash019564 [Apostasia shenzhenica]|uniref:G domain-containing protein n=1 Tax=Apostasia shenzhenica TaxID=1088818 RepID=A0A2I0AV41_9ASPA|nr:hypothetical protein AXF42_Ash019564 [Apostasia shenzhenica]
MGGGRNLCDAFPLKSPTSVNGKSLIDSDASIFTVEEQSCDSNVDWQPSSFSSSRAFGATFETFGAGDAEQQSEDFNSFIQSYCRWRPPSRSLDDAKLAILRHKPGDWIEKVGGLGAEDYDIPERITLLLIGPRSSGKSCLVNKITRVFDDDPSASDRAQVSYSGSAEGTCFLQEYPIPRNSSSLCLYDTRSLSIVPSDNLKLLERWMNEGVSHGEPVIL